MKVCGVIAEYDPFHRGHERHLRLAREKTGADFILCVMSGFYTQRGMPAMLPPDVRAHMALLSGADAVVQLPAAFSAREGDVFARAGVEILHRFGCVDYLSFGCETDDLLLLQKAAALLEDKPETMERDVQEGLKKGLSFAAAQGKAMENALGADAGKLQLPNAALALGYLRALRQLNSCMQPVAVLRDTDYHAGEMEKYPSATAVRSALYRGDWQAVERAVPQKALPVLKRAVQQGRIFRPEGMDTLLRYALLQLGEEGIRKLPGVDEGLERRILSAAREQATWADMLEHVKTRRYTRGRIARAFCWAVLGTMKEELPRQICGVQVLGFCESARPLLKKMQEGSLPLYMKKAREGSLLTENKYADIWQLMAGRDMGEHYRQGPVIIREE
ncbi:MAG: nucleotidyltransferase family protein [Clostridia bacterium]|nr:nucleotidyltransferase family protein [Clostridia bacterium]